MARRKKASGGGGGGGDWLNTYADMVTLLLTFFILLFSMSSLDAAKFNMLVTAFADSNSTSDSKIVINGLMEGAEQEGLAPQGEQEEGMVADSQKMAQDEALEKIYQILKQYVEDNNLESSVSVSKEDNTVFISFMNNMLFEPNSAVLKVADREILQFVGYAIKSVETYAKLVSINGHTAAIPEDPNYPVSDRLLSSARADAVLMFFEDQIGVEPSIMFSQGWGKYKPIADNTTEAGRSQNRRVEILISGENLLSEQLDNIYEKLVQ